MVSRMKWSMVLLLSLVLVALARPGPVYGHGGSPASGDAWMENYTLILTDAKNITEAYQAQKAVESAGGQVYVIIPNRVMLGRVPADAVKSLVGKGKIRGIYHKPVGGTVSQGLDKSSANAVAFFNEVASGAWKARKDEAKAMMAGRPAPKMLLDAFVPPPISYIDYLANLEAQGITEERLKAEGISLEQPEPGAGPSPGNSEYLTGKVVFNAIFVESNGAIDRNWYTWTAADKTTIQNEISAGLSWWASTAQSSAYNTPLTFVTLWHTGGTSYEPILHKSTDDGLWISEIMGIWGYNTGDKFARCTAFNTKQRITYKANWSVASFIGYNPGTAPTRFTDGWFAYAWLRGPYSQLLYRNNGWAVSDYDRVNAHETGHLFGAPDEYSGGWSCGTTAPTTNGVYNGNCEKTNPNAIPCVMRANSSALCGYTPGHVGWNSIQYLTAQTITVSGVEREFFAQGQSMNYRAYFCLGGPRIGTTLHDYRVKFRAEFFNGTVDAPGTTVVDSGWLTAVDAVNPPTSTGLNCYYSTWGSTIPYASTYGAATLTVALATEKYGKGAVSKATRFYVGSGANPTTAATPAAFGDEQEALAQKTMPFLTPAPSPCNCP